MVPPGPLPLAGTPLQKYTLLGITVVSPMVLSEPDLEWGGYLWTVVTA